MIGPRMFTLVELPLSLVLSSMERSGIGLDTNELTCLDTMLTDKITTLQNEFIIKRERVLIYRLLSN